MVVATATARWCAMPLAGPRLPSGSLPPSERHLPQLPARPQWLRRLLQPKRSPNPPAVSVAAGQRQRARAQLARTSTLNRPWASSSVSWLSSVG